MADVAERAGVGVGTLYHHFPDKRALLLALIDDWGDRELAQGRSEHDVERLLGDDPRAAFGDDLRASYERLRRDGGFFLVLLELAERDSDVRTRLNRIDQVAIERFARSVRARPEPRRDAHGARPARRRVPGAALDPLRRDRSASCTA